MKHRRLRFALRNDPWSRFQLVVVALAVVVVVGTVGYMIIGLSPLDALYQTVITISTVGYREVGDSSSDAYRIFTIILIPLGTGLAFYGAAIMIESLIEIQLSPAARRTRMNRRIEQYENHVIICGLGQVGAAIASAIVQMERDVVIIDLGDDANAAAQSEQPIIVGDATHDSVLREAGIERASCLVVAMNSDAANVYVTLSGRAIRPDLFIVSRSVTAEGSEKLIRAGADRVVNPHELGGTHMAALVAQPNVTDFMNVTMHDRELHVRIQELEVEVGRDPAPTVGVLREQGQVSVLAVRRNRQFTHRPKHDFALERGDVVIALGTVDDLAYVDDLIH